MPPVLALAPLAGSVLGAELLPGLAGLLGGGELLGGAGLFGATLGETVGGVLGGAATSALTNDDPLVGGLTGAVSGLGGPGLASGLEGAVSAGAGALGLGADTAAAAAPTSLLPAAGVGTGTVTEGASAVGGGGAAAIAAPEAAGTGLDAALGTSLTPDLAGGAGSSTVGSTIGADADALASGGAAVDGNPFAGGAGDALSAPAAGGNTFETLLQDPSWKNFSAFTGANKDLITGGLGLATSALAGDKAFPGEAQLRAQAKGLSAQANKFMSGELTPGMEAGLRGATESAKAAMRSMFAQRGMSGSSSEVEALASIDQTAAVKGAEIAQSLIRQGVQELQLAGNLWQTILASSLQRDNELGSAIGSFASSLAGGQRAA